MLSFECFNCGWKIQPWENDYKDMYKFQNRFMWADHKWRHFQEVLEKIRAYRTYANAEGEIHALIDEALAYKYEMP